MSEPCKVSLSLWAAASPCGSVVQCALDPDRRMIPGFIAAILLVAAAAGGAAAQSNTTTTPDCGHVMDCTNMTSGWYADPFNCRKYWH